MPENPIARLATREKLVERVTGQQVRVPAAEPGHDQGHGTPSESVREATYRGHRITVRTSYRIEVDGMPIEGHMGVTNDGQVHYHAIPNIGFASAVDLVKQLIDTFPDDFEPVPSDTDTDTHAHTTEQGP